MKIYLIRHGETNENAGSLLMGRTHGVLSEKGITQAMLTGERFKSENIKIIYTSPLNRCLDTANLINKSLSLPVEINNLLIERDFGSFTNTSYQNFSFDELDKDTEENKNAGVETLDVVKSRVKTFLQNIFSKHKNENVAVVTHNNPMRFFLGEFLNKSYTEILDEYKVKNCSVNIFETEDGINYKQILLDDTSHLNKTEIYNK
jgi:broad specificity phosphatase PhoE